MNQRSQKNREEGAALVEYSLLIAGVALVAAAAVSIFGHKTNDMISATATVLPGAHADDNAPIVSGKLIETTQNPDGSIAVDLNTIATDAANTGRLGNNLLGTDNNGSALLQSLVVEANEEDS